MGHCVHSVFLVFSSGSVTWFCHFLYIPSGRPFLMPFHFIFSAIITM